MEDAEEKVDLIFDFESKLAKASKSKEDRRDAEELYNLRKIKDMEQLEGKIYMTFVDLINIFLMTNYFCFQIFSMKLKG